MRSHHKRRVQASSRNSILQIEQFEERLLLTTMFLDFGDGISAGLTASTTVGELRRFGLGQAGLGIHGNGLGPDFTFIDPVTQQPFRDESDIFEFERLALDVDGDNVNEPLSTFVSAVVPIVERIVEPFDIDVQVVSDVTRDPGSGGLNFSTAHQTLAQSPDADAYILIGDDNVLHPSVFGIAAGDDLFGQAPIPNQQDELALVNPNNILELNNALLPRLVDPDSLGDHVYLKAATVIVHEAFHTFSFTHTEGFGDLSLMDVMGSPTNLFFEEDFGGFLATEPAPAIVTRFDLPLDNGPGTVDNYQLAMDIVGFRDENGNLTPDTAYVTGTGLHDEITLTALASGIVNVSVQPFENESRTIPSGTAKTYSIDLSGGNLPIIDSTDGVLLIEPSRGNDKVILSGNFTQSNSNAHVRIRAGGEDDTLEVASNAEIPKVTFEGERGGDSIVSLATNAIADLTFVDSITTESNSTAAGGGVNSQENTIQFGPNGGNVHVQLSFDFAGQSGTFNYDFGWSNNTQFSLKVTAVDELFNLLGTDVGNPDYNDSFNVVGGSIIDSSDRDFLVLVVMGTFFGDANLDGTVDADDLNTVGLNWQQSVESWATGDFNNDGITDAADLNALGVNWLMTNGNS